MVERSNIRNRTLFIGDNLDFLRGINSESVDLIYLNPQCNSGRDQRGGGVQHPDTWSLSNTRDDWLEETELRCPGAPPIVEVARIAQGDVQPLFGHIDAYEDRSLLHKCLPSNTGPSLQDAGLVSPRNCSGSVLKMMRRPSLLCSLV
ncbi:MAG: hypothetical protein F4X94_09430 [Dehalococcoidia bacterium]|nr:hypothetical protein [Dehalococcoidia bacterium]